MVSMGRGKAIALDAVCLGLFLGLSLLFVSHFVRHKPDKVVSEEGSESAQNVVVLIKSERPGNVEGRDWERPSTRVTRSSRLIARCHSMIGFPGHGYVTCSR